jgi:hypothetical protein
VTPSNVTGTGISPFNPDIFTNDDLVRHRQTNSKHHPKGYAGNQQDM